MSFIQRFFRYLLGIVIGCVIVYMMFPNRDWLSWTPSKSLMRQISYFPLNLNEDIQCRLRCEPDLAPRIARARAFGRPDFANSETRSTPKVYLIRDGRSELTVTILNDSIITLVKINGDEICDCP